MFKVTASKLNEIKVFEFPTEDEAITAMNAMPEGGYTVIALSEVID